MTEGDVSLLARLAGLVIAPAHLPGVLRNLAILYDQAALLAAEPLDPLVEPAPVYRP
jgi:hypothetical protein